MVAPILAHPARSTIYPPALWRRIADDAKPESELAAEFAGRARHDNPADAAIRAELLALADRLYDLILDRVHRLLALGRLVPQARDEHEALARAGLTWEDTGLPENLAFDGPWLPTDLSEARKLLAWLLAHPPSLPRADPSETSASEA
jgi:hypothetical protein